MAFEGMDSQQVNTLGVQLNTQASHIGDVIGQVTNLVHQLDGVWKGRDAQQFVQDWNSVHRQALVQAQHAVETLGKLAIANAARQAETSSQL